MRAGVFRPLPSIAKLLLLFHLAGGPVGAGAEPAMLAIIIDDLGNARVAGERAASLPGPVICSVLPHTPYAVQLARRCKEEGKEVLLHQPMQPLDPRADPGRGVLFLGQRREAFRSELMRGLAAVPGVDGVNNHMGSLLTRHIAYMHWLMQDLSERRGLFFIDSMTTTHSRALAAARLHGLPSTRRDVFLDDDPSPAAIRTQWDRLLARARAQGSALGIGHPWPETLDTLDDGIRTLGDEGIILVGIAELIRFRESGVRSWPESLSRSRMASKR
jgi:polysaccharide deacetylase 2 family uncharacterized protein YibQ